MKNNPKEQKRDKKIVAVSIISIAANVVLASFKAAAGLVSGSISIILDAVNNLSDALSSIITIIGTKLSLKPADKKHPFGYGRIEYLSASIIAAIVLYAGFTSLKESIVKIIHPQKAEYSTVTIAIVATAVFVKFILGVWVKKQGKDTDSKSLIASGEDARNDAFLSAGVLAGALIAKFTGFSLEAYIGCIISLFILKSGIEMLKDTLDDILGSRISKELSRNVKKNIAAFPNVLGAYDLSLNSYGPDRMIGSVHIEVPENMTAKEIDDLSIKITNAIYKENNVALSAIGIYSHNSDTSEAAKYLEGIKEITDQYKDVMQIHGFYLSKEDKLIKFDIIISFDAKDREEQFKEIHKKICKKYPDFKIHMNLDADLSD